MQSRKFPAWRDLNKSTIIPGNFAGADWKDPEKINNVAELQLQKGIENVPFFIFHSA
jgi:hypothetical protein